MYIKTTCSKIDRIQDDILQIAVVLYNIFFL